MKFSLVPSAALVVTAALVQSAPASAHAFITDMEVEAGAYHVVEIGIPHGCGGTATTAVKVKVPEGISLVRPEVKAGWKLSYTLRKSGNPYVTSEGTRLTEVVDEITWSGGKLADSEFERFSVMVKLPDAANQTLYFKTIQVCEKGEHRWVEVARPGQNAGELKLPSPYLNLLPSKGWVLPITPAPKAPTK